MIVGFTGTRLGLTSAQKIIIHDLLEQLDPDAFRHGDCIGADEEAAQIAHELCIPVVGHPPIEDKYRAFFPSDKTFSPKEYHARDKDIVHACNLLIAAPKCWPVSSGGTKYTIEYAKKIGRQYFVVTPEGEIEAFNSEEGIDC